MFYTNVQPFGDNIALRGVDNRGETFMKKIPYEPTLFVVSSTNHNQKWHTLDGKQVAPVKWGSMKESRQAILDYPGDVYGIDQNQYAFIASSIS